MHINNYFLDFNHELYFFADDILQISGLGEISTTYEITKNAGGNGSIIIGRNVNERNIVLICRIDRKKSDFIARYFKPQNNYVLYVGDRKINCVCELSKISYDDGYYVEPCFTLNLFCPDPYFYDISDFGKNIAGIMPMFGFPWRVTKATGITFGYRIFSERTIFLNNGDAPVGLRIVFLASRGTADNISIENLRTGQFLKVNTHLDRYDKLEISTISGQKYIKKNDISIFEQIDRFSDFFDLDVGDNLLKYDTENGRTNLDVYLYYTPVYLNGEVVEV